MEIPTKKVRRLSDGVEVVINANEYPDFPYEPVEETPEPIETPEPALTAAGR